MSFHRLSTAHAIVSGTLTFSLVFGVVTLLGFGPLEVRHVFYALLGMVLGSLEFKK